MSDYNEDYEYALEKIKGTIVRLKDGTPVLVANVLLREKVVDTYSLMKAGQEKKVKLKDMDLRSPPLGFVNYKNKAQYVSRIPKRRDWRQGVRAENCMVYPGDWQFNDLFSNSNSLGNCIANNYPTLDNILKKFARGGQGRKLIAWCRHWAVDNDLSVFYKDWGKVGRLDEATRTMVFDEKFSFLRENFEESVK